MSDFYTYIVYFERNGLFEIGVTNDLSRRIRLLSQINNRVKGNPCKLVYFKEFAESSDATELENDLKKIPNKYLRQIVEEMNPMFTDLLKAN